MALSFRKTSLLYRHIHAYSYKQMKKNALKTIYQRYFIVNFSSLFFLFLSLLLLFIFHIVCCGISLVLRCVHRRHGNTGLLSGKWHQTTKIITGTTGSDDSTTCFTNRVVIIIRMHEHHFWLWHFGCHRISRVQHMAQSSQVRIDVVYALY